MCYEYLAGLVAGTGPLDVRRQYFSQRSRRATRAPVEATILLRSHLKEPSTRILIREWEVGERGVVVANAWVGAKF